MTCRIRLFRTADAESLYEAVVESFEDLEPWMPWCHPGYSLDVAREWISTCEERTRQKQEYHFAILDAAERLVGACGLNQFNTAHRFANLGYWVRTSAAGQGIAPVAVGFVKAFARAETDLVRLEIVCAVDNRRSQRVAEKVGGRREGILSSRLFLHGKAHDAVMYALVP